MISGGRVRHVIGAIGRWLCPSCGRVFTHWPEFAIPRRRYVRQDVEEYPRRYVEDEARTYEEAASEDGRRIVHDADGALPVRMAPPIPGMKEEPLPSSLAPSTVWRWVGWLGRQEEVLQEARDLIGKRDPSADFHRTVIVVRPAKYRSPERHVLIVTTALLLRALARIRGPP